MLLLEGILNNQQPVTQMNYQNMAQPVQQNTGGRERFNNQPINEISNSVRGDRNFNNRKQESQQSVPTFTVDFRSVK